MYKEDFATLSAAAIHGGVTQVADMPNNPVAPVDDATLCGEGAADEGVAPVHVTLYAGIGPGRTSARHGMCRTRRSWALRSATCSSLRRTSWKK